jgi:hypothetical protein
LRACWSARPYCRCFRRTKGIASSRLLTMEMVWLQPASTLCLRTRAAAGFVPSSARANKAIVHCGMCGSDRLTQHDCSTPSCKQRVTHDNGIGVWIRCHCHFDKHWIHGWSDGRIMRSADGTGCAGSGILCRLDFYALHCQLGMHVNVARIDGRSGCMAFGRRIRRWLHGSGGDISFPLISERLISSKTHR